MRLKNLWRTEFVWGLHAERCLKNSIIVLSQGGKKNLTTKIKELINAAKDVYKKYNTQMTTNNLKTPTVIKRRN